MKRIWKRPCILLRLLIVCLFIHHCTSETSDSKDSESNGDKTNNKVSDQRENKRENLHLLNGNSGKRAPNSHYIPSSDAKKKLNRNRNEDDKRSRPWKRKPVQLSLEHPPASKKRNDFASNRKGHRRSRKRHHSKDVTIPRKNIIYKDWFLDKLFKNKINAAFSKWYLAHSRRKPHIFSAASKKVARRLNRNKSRRKKIRPFNLVYRYDCNDEVVCDYNYFNGEPFIPSVKSKRKPKVRGYIPRYSIDDSVSLENIEESAEYKDEDAGVTGPDNSEESSKSLSSEEFSSETKPSHKEKDESIAITQIAHSKKAKSKIENPLWTFTKEKSGPERFGESSAQAFTPPGKPSKWGKSTITPTHIREKTEAESTSEKGTEPSEKSFEIIEASSTSPPVTHTTIDSAITQDTDTWATTYPPQSTEYLITLTEKGVPYPTVSPHISNKPFSTTAEATKERESNSTSFSTSQSSIENKTFLPVSEQPTENSTNFDHTTIQSQQSTSVATVVGEATTQTLASSKAFNDVTTQLPATSTVFNEALLHASMVFNEATTPPSSTVFSMEATTQTSHASTAFSEGETPPSSTVLILNDATTLPSSMAFNEVASPHSSMVFNKAMNHHTSQSSSAFNLGNTQMSYSTTGFNEAKSLPSSTVFNRAITHHTSHSSSAFNLANTQISYGTTVFNDAKSLPSSTVFNQAIMQPSSAALNEAPMQVPPSSTVLNEAPTQAPPSSTVLNEATSQAPPSSTVLTDATRQTPHSSPVLQIETTPITTVFQGVPIQSSQMSTVVNESTSQPLPGSTIFNEVNIQSTPRGVTIDVTTEPQPSTIDLKQDIEKALAEERLKSTGHRTDVVENPTVSLVGATNGTSNAEAVSAAGKDVAAVATNGTQANSLAATDGGSGNAISKSLTLEGDANSLALNGGNGTAISSALAQGSNNEASSDALALNNNAKSQALAEKGANAVAGAVTKNEGNATSKSAATDGGNADSVATVEGKGNAWSGSATIGGGQANSHSESNDGNAVAKSVASDGGLPESASEDAVAEATASLSGDGKSIAEAHAESDAASDAVHNEINNIMSMGV